MKIILAHQRIFSARSGVAVGAEMLARWQTLDGNIITPTSAIPSDWGAVDLAIARQAARCYQGRVGGTFVFLNVSEALLSAPINLSTWLDYLRQIQRCGMQCVIEVTEGVSDTTLQERWDDLKLSGALLAMDDFGSKCSTINRLKAFAWDFCKIDARLIASGSDTNRAIDFCTAKHIGMVAERVEDKATKSLATSAGILLHQGFLWEHPIIETPTLKEGLAC